MSGKKQRAEREQSSPRPEEMLRALNAAAAIIQRAARSPQTVFEAVSRELEHLGCRSVVVMLDEGKQHFSVRYVNLFSVPAAGQKLLKETLIDRAFPTEIFQVYQQLVETGQTILDPEPAENILQALPASLYKLAPLLEQAAKQGASISAPLLVGGELTGILSVIAPTLSQADVPAITAFADQISAALENAQLYEQVERQGQETATISGIVQAVNVGLGVKDVFSAIARELGTLVAFDRASIALISEDKQSFTMYALAPTDQPDVPLSEGVTMPATATAASPNVSAGRPHLTLDLSTETAYPGDRLLYEAGLRSRVNVPLQSGDLLLGALNLASTRLAAFSQHHVVLLQQVTGAIAAAIRNARLYEQVERQRQEAATISGIVQALNASLSVKDVFSAVARELGTLVAFDRASIALISEDLQTFTVYTLLDQPNAPLDEGVTMPVQATASEANVRAGRPHLTADLATETDFAVERILYESGLRSRINVPLLFGDQLLGVLNLASTRLAAFSQHHVDLLQQVAGAIAAAIRNAQLYEQVQVSGARYRHLVENIHDLIFEVDAQGMCTFVSPVVEPLLGYEASEIVNRPFAGFVYPDDLPIMQQRVNRTLGGEHSREPAEFRVLARDGGVIWVRSLSRPVVRDGQVVGLTGTATDITARKQAEAALQRRDAILNAVSFAAEQFLGVGDFDLSIQAVLMHLGEATEVSRVYVFENHVAVDDTLLTSQRHEWVADGIEPQLANPDLQDLPWIEAGFQRWVETLGHNDVICGLVSGFPASERAILEAQDIRSIIIVPVFVAGEWWGFIGFDDCVHERSWSPAEVEALRAAARTLGAAIQRQRTERALRQLKVFHENIVQGIAEGIIIEDEHGRITFVNPALETLLGYTAPELIGQHWSAIIIEEQVDKVHEETDRRPRGIAGRYETVLLSREGQQIPAIISAQPLFENDAFVGVLTAITDITERKAMEEAVQRHNEQLAALHETALDLAAQRALPDVLQAIVARAVDLLAAKSGAVLVYRPRTDDLQVACEYGVEQGFLGTVLQRGEGLAGRVLETAKPLTVEDYGRWDGRSTQFQELLPDSMVAVPIRWGDRFFGVISVLDRAPRTFHPADVALLERFTPLAAAALEQARLLDEARRRAKELGILYEVITAATTSMNLDEVLDQTVDTLHHELEADNISIQLIEPETGDLIVRAAIGFSTDGSPLIGQRVKAGLGIIGWAVQTGHAILSPDVRADDRYHEYDPDTRSELCVPLRVGSRTIGVLDLESHQVNAFTASDLHLVSTLTSNLATVIENAWLAQETRQRADTLAALHETALDLSAQRALPDVLQAIVTRAVGLLAAKGGGVYLYRPASDDLEYVLSYRLPRDYTGMVLQRGEGLSGKILETGKSLTVDDYSRWNSQSTRFDEVRPESIVGVPIHWGDRFLGVLNVLDDVPRTFSPADVALLERFTPLAAAALEQTRLLEEAQRRAADLGILYNVITAATTSAYLDEILDHAMDALRQALQVDGVAILLTEPRTGDLVNRAVAGFADAEAMVGRRVEAGRGIAGWVARTGQSLLVPDVREDDRYLVHDPGTRSELCVPLFARSRIIGVLNLESYQLGAFTEADLSLVSTLAGNLATVIDNARLVQDLRESEEKYKTLVKTSPEAVTATDLEGRITDLSQRTLELHGAKHAEELIGRNSFDLIAPEDHERALYNAQKTLEEGVVRNVEYIMLRKDGTRFIGELSAALIKDAAGSPQAFIATVRDITERKRLEEQLRQAQKMEAIGTLAGGIAHDFNNLLGGILGFASLMERDLPADSPLRTPVETIIGAARRGAELTNQLLAFARGGRYEVHPTDLNDQVREVIQLLSRTVDKSIAIEPILAEDLAAVEGDTGQLYQMLLNLCLNACDAMPAGGQLTIKTETVTLAAEHLHADVDLKPGPYVQLCVIDTGIGMDAETRQRIFEPFFTTKKGRPGKQHSGLGLSMVYGIVRSHGGSIRAHSEPGQGSTFEVRLPAIELPAASTTARIKESGDGSETILVVDDEDFIRVLLQQALEGVGYTVLLAGDGLQALAVYQDRGADIDLIVLDMGLPRLSGAETFQRLQEIEPQVAVLISSGYTEDDRTRALLAAGARGFLVKPYDIDELLHKIRQILDGQ